MNKIRFFYNPDNKSLKNCGSSSHALYFHNNKLKGKFDEYIRGIIYNKTIYIRVFYPYEDIYNPLPYVELIKKSGQLIRFYLKDIKKAIKRHYKLKVFKIAINITNEDLKTYLKTCFV